eukprot:XP_017947265.1 PREDICTED: cell surface glycoprotein CD200 receptor 2-like [Xenopus tropicalis]
METHLPALICLAFIYGDAEPPVSVTESVRVWAGSSTVLRCRQDPGDQLVLLTWKVQLLDNSHCTLALNWENLTNRNNCSERMRQENTSLRIENTAVTDQGNYTCQFVNTLGTFFTSVLLEVLVEPSVTLELNKLGVPECRAHGGNPAANISWIPEGSISTNRAMEPDRSWTVSSTYTATSSNVTQVTCIVSHPTFPQPHSSSISTAGSGRILWVRVTVSIIVVIMGLFLIVMLFSSYGQSWAQGCLREVKMPEPQGEEKEEDEDEEEAEWSHTQVAAKLKALEQRVSALEKQNQP